MDGPGFIPGFTEQLTGMRPGEVREVKVTFPEDVGLAEALLTPLGQ